MQVSVDVGKTWRAADTPLLHDLDNTIKLPGATLRWGPLSGIVGPNGVPPARTHTALRRCGHSRRSTADLVPGRALALPRPRAHLGPLLGGASGCVHHLAFRADGEGLAADTNGQILLRTKDFGSSWRSVTVPWTPARLLALITEADVFLALTHDPACDVEAVWHCADDGSWTYAGSPSLR